MQQAACPLEHLLLGLSPALAGEAVVLVSRESAGEVLAHVAVGDLLRAVHEHLGAVVELGDAVHRQQQGEGLLQGERVMAAAQETVGIVVLDKGHDARRVRVEVVVDEGAVEAVEASEPGVGLLLLGLVDLVEE